MIQKETAERILKTYEEAWVEQDTAKVLSIFHDDGVYHERVLKDSFKGHEEIKKHWQSKVVEEQSKIEFKLLNYYIDNNTLIAEWDVSFNSNIKNVRLHLQEVAIMEIEDGKIKYYREYWHSEEIKDSV